MKAWRDATPCVLLRPLCENCRNWQNMKKVTLAAWESHYTNASHGTAFTAIGIIPITAFTAKAVIGIIRF